MHVYFSLHVLTRCMRLKLLYVNISVTIITNGLISEINLLKLFNQNTKIERYQNQSYHID